MWILRKKLLTGFISIGVLAVIFLSAVMLSGCGINKNQGNQNSSANGGQEDTESKILEDFQGKLANNAPLTEIVKFLEQNIPRVSKENAVVMVDGFEKKQKEFLPQLEQKYFAGNEIQSKISKIYLSEFDLSKVENTEDEELKELLAETKDSGYKLETAEGIFFPVINYEYYKKFSTYLTPDLQGYIDLMAVESNKTPAKDAALVIDWGEVLERASKQEQFIVEHENSIKIGEVKALYKKYLTFALFGANNTPLFSYDTKTMDPEAKETYLQTIEKSTNGQFRQTISDFMEVLKKSDYKLTAEVDKYRKDIIEDFKL